MVPRESPRFSEGGPAVLRRKFGVLRGKFERNSALAGELVFPRDRRRFRGKIARFRGKIGLNWLFPREKAAHIAVFPRKTTISLL